MIQRPLIAALNHILRQNEWPLPVLRGHAGREVLLRMPPAPDLHLRIQSDGLLADVRAGSNDLANPSPVQPPDLTVSLRPDALPGLLRRDAEALRKIELSGAADLAQLVQRLLHELRWDVEEDLSRFVGDILAHRLVSAGRDLLAWQTEAARRLSRNFTEYWTEEKPTLVTRSTLESFAREIAASHDAVDALADRVDALRRKQTG